MVSKWNASNHWPVCSYLITSYEVSLSFDPRGFEGLVKKALPKNLKNLRDQIKRNPIAINKLSTETILKIRERLGIEKGDAPGCYAFVKAGKPFYVGISRKIISRLRQHFRGKSHFAASLAYRMAKESVGKSSEKMTREGSMKNKAFRKAFDKAKSNLGSASVVVIKIESPEEMYLFEIYAAMQFKTFELNSFETH